MSRNIFPVLLALILTGLLSGCNKWDDHNAITDPRANQDLFQQINENSELSRFAELLVKSGNDKLISSSKNFTVFAPTNAALAALDPAIINDSAKLRMFVLNHITSLSYYSTTTTAKVRLPMLNGKFNNFLGRTIEDANLTEADKFAKNGVLQIIDKMLPALPNTWELLGTSTAIPAKQKNYMLNLFQKVRDLTNAVQVGVDPVTGEPIYQAGTDSVVTNIFWRNVHDLRTESKQYTLFILADAAWDAEVNKFKPYYATGTVDSTTNLSTWAVVKDLAVDTLYQPGTIPDTILSKFNTKVGIEKSAIVQTIKTSNGIVYIMNKVSVRPVDKFQQYIIEGERYRTMSIDRRGNTYLRDKLNNLTGKQFRDVLVYNHGVALFNLNYRLNEVPALKFRAYWVAVNDNINGSTVTHQQKLSISTPGTATSTNLPYITVPLNDYSEKYLGEFTMNTYSPFLDLYLTAANNTTANTNLLVCDYIRLEPVF